jgi:hypothetical protein
VEVEFGDLSIDDRAVLEDTLEPVLSQWPGWSAKQRELIQDGRGLPGKDAATYRLAAIEADADPPALLDDIIARARAPCAQSFVCLFLTAPDVVIPAPAPGKSA